MTHCSGTTLCQGNLELRQHSDQLTQIVWQGSAIRVVALREEYESGNWTEFDDSECAPNVTGLVVRLLMKVTKCCYCCEVADEGV